ncbi:MAG: hypothetical protein A2Y07_01785 [Planctomycetes bacterium GWF2_50_10]|nr:MAG: hypothetical protein A2Y07_01785 [Planctomycetes bacterium GWF2_50_10]
MSRRGQKSIVLLVAAAIAFFVYLDRTGRIEGLGARPHSPAVDNNLPSQDDLAKYHLKTFIVTKVVDGDTLDINLPDGKYKTTRIRLLGVDTPETKKPNTAVMHFGPQAYEFTKNVTLGKKVVVVIDTISRPRDRYGRLLGYVRLENGNILNQLLVEQGYAYADLRFKHTEFDKYKILMDEAQQNKKGLWKDAKLKDLPPWLQKLKPKILKKAA